MLALASCGPATGHVERAKVEAFASGSLGAGERVEVRELAGHPRVALVKREGDAVPAFAVVGSVAGPREALSLALVFEARLVEAGVPVRARADLESFALGFYAADPSAVVAQLRSALAKPIGEADVARLEARLDAVHPPIAEPFLAATAACEGELALPRAWKHLTAAELERARASVFSSASLVVGGAGDGAFGDALAKAVAATDPFPAGAPVGEGAALPARSTAGRLESVGDGASEIRVAISLPDPRKAVSVARAFGGAPAAALGAKLARLSVPFTLARVSGVAHARGGCVSVRLEGAPASDDAKLDAALLAAGLASRDLGAAARGEVDPDVALASVLDASDPVEAAELAAWWSAASTASGSPPATSIAVAFSQKAPDALVARAEAGLRDAESKAPSGGPDLVTREEHGQGELWVLLANPCAAESESLHLWGSGGAAMLARAGGASAQGVTVEPLVSPAALGVVAHAAPLRGETGDELARRVAGRAAEAMLGGPPTTDELLGAAGRARETLERAWGRETLGLEAFASAMSPDHPAAFEPLGSFATLTRGDVARGVAAWQVVARGPLRLAVLANESASQGPAALAAVSRWMLPGAAPRCPTATASEPQAGHVEVRADQGAQKGLSRALIGIPLGRGADASDVGEALRALFDGPTSLADGALRGIERAKLTARVIGAPAALVLVVEAPDERLGDAEKAVTDLVSRVGRGEITDDALSRALTQAFGERERRASDPRERALSLLLGHAASQSFAPVRVDAARFRAWARGAAVEGRLTIVDAHR